MTKSGFIMAEKIEESERLYLSMTREQLIENCIAAASEILPLMTAAEKLGDAVDNGRAAESLCRKFFSIFETQVLILSSPNLEGRQKRRLRDEALEKIKAVSLAAIETELPSIEWPATGRVVREFGEREVPAHG
jgi:hypothetical protein